MSPPALPTTSVAATTNKSRSLRRGQEERGGLRRQQPERSASFHGRTLAAPAAEQRQMRRPKTQPDLLPGGRRGASPETKPQNNEAAGSKTSGGERKLPAKVLLNVTVQRSLGAVQVMASTEWTVDDLVAAAVRLYVKEGRRPPLSTTEPSAFGLHYSQFSLEGLDPKEKLMGLGSRNFFLCPKSVPPVTAQGPVQPATPARLSSPTLPSSSTTSTSTSCSNEAGKACKTVIPWLKFLDFLL